MNMFNETIEHKKQRAIELALKLDWPCMVQDLNNVDFFLSHLSKIERAQKIARDVGCPYSRRDFVHVNRFLKELEGIQHTNMLLSEMDFDPIDFDVKRQTVAEYLQQEDRETQNEFLLKILCYWQANAKLKQKERQVHKILQRVMQN